MQCSHCPENAVISHPARCKNHFVEEFEHRVKDTIERFDLMKPDMRIAVAASGGKDSLTVLHLLKKWCPDVTAIAVDEGIADYREHSLKDLRAACEKLDVPLILTSYKEFCGFTLDEILQKHKLHPCTVCGTFRRHLIALKSKEFDVLVTGHNMDDEAQTVLMNIIKGNTNIFPRGGPKSGVGAVGFTQRVKPLYFVTEKEVMTYAYLKGFVTKFTECPNAPSGYRYGVREAFNAFVKDHPDARKILLEKFLAMKETFADRHEQLQHCENCGEPSAKPVCRACEFLEVVHG